MWRRTYLLLALVRLYFALSTSYLHPDENFQGPEVIAGQIFSYPIRLTWEFTTAEPVRSVFPLWPVYGLPMLLLKWLWIGNGKDGEIPTVAVFWTLRLLMFFLSFVFEDWAIHELVSSPRHRKVAVVLVASSYVTWTYQTHTFSNSIETLMVAWSLVLIQRIVETPRKSSLGASAMLAVVAVFGIFNRITFPAFLFIPGLRLIPHFYRKPFSFLSFLLSGLITTALAIAIDTEFYNSKVTSWGSLIASSYTITPLNNLRYNLSTTNLAQHGLHPWYQHIVNLVLLLGPAILLIPHRVNLSLSSPLLSAIPGIAALSASPHQEARFLLPTVPLILASLGLPKNRLHLKLWAITWLCFNVAMGFLMGSYHQAGIVPTQLHMAGMKDATNAVWWKTYSPPIWLLNGKNEVLTTHDVMGMPASELREHLATLATCHPSNKHPLEDQVEGTYLIAPLSTPNLDSFLAGSDANGTLYPTELRMEEVWRYHMHLNLDDLDWADDGIWSTLKRVIGRRGIATWRVTKNCGK